MLLEEINRIQSGHRECRRFAWIIGPLLLALGAWLLWKQATAGPWLLAAGGLMLGLGFLSPALLKWPWLAWMTVGLVLGAVVSALLLGAFFYLILTPVGLLARVTGKDFLELKKPKGANSYWHSRTDTPPKDRYERQF